MESYLRLESELARWIGTNPENIVVCSSGTAALHLAFEALQLPQGSEVIMSNFNMIACPRAVTMAGLVPFFVDCDDKLLINPDLFDNNWEPTNVKAILVTHIYGRRCDMEAISRISMYNEDMPIIEDLAEAHGVRPMKETDAACYSFYKNKIIAGEEGGAVSFKNSDHAQLARQLRSLGFTDAHDFMHIPRGHNYRLANCLADKILESLKQYTMDNSVLNERRSLEAAYDKVCPDVWKMPYRDAPWVYDLRIPGLTYEKQGEIVKALNEAGIAARHAFKPMSMQPEYKNVRLVVGVNAERASREVVYLPLSPHPNAFKDVNRAFDIICRLVG